MRSENTVSFSEYSKIAGQNSENNTAFQKIMNEILTVQEKILSYSTVNERNEGSSDAPPPDIVIGAINDRSGYYYNYDGYHEYGEYEYQRPDYDTQEYIKGNFPQ